MSDTEIGAIYGGVVGTIIGAIGYFTGFPEIGTAIIAALAASLLTIAAVSKREGRNG